MMNNYMKKRKRSNNDYKKEFWKIRKKKDYNNINLNPIFPMQNNIGKDLSPVNYLDNYNNADNNKNFPFFQISTPPILPGIPNNMMPKNNIIQNSMPNTFLMNNNNTNPHICFCGSGNFSVNALKIKDEMIIKYKDKIDENNEILKLTQNSNNSNNSNNNRSNELNFIEKDYNIPNKYKKEKNDGFEDYLLGKIVNNQKEVLGERAPRFYENNNININNKYVAKSMQYDDGNKMNNRYNNYHYRGRIMEDDE